MIRQIATTSKYRKDWELAKRRNLPIEELNDVIYKLASDIPFIQTYSRNRLQIRPLALLQEGKLFIGYLLSTTCVNS